jgi:hypothetical protein
MQAPAEKFLLCRPDGGLNDMLCQIGKCATYAEQHGRMLVVDAFATSFGDDLGRYFAPVDSSIVFANPQILRQLETLDVFPRTLAGRVNAYRHQFSMEHRNWVTVDSNEPISFDFTRDYDEPLLVHHARGGGNQSSDALQRLTLRRHMVEKFYARISIVGRNYAGIHVRHTDYRSDYVSFFQSLAGKVQQDRIVICTDSREVLEYGKAFFSQRVYSFAAIPHTGGRPLHEGNRLNKQVINTDAILDLITLARARSLFITKVSSGHYSGYSRLAAALNQNQPLVDALLGRTRKTAVAGTV